MLLDLAIDDLQRRKNFDLRAQVYLLPKTSLIIRCSHRDLPRDSRSVVRTEEALPGETSSFPVQHCRACQGLGSCQRPAGKKKCTRWVHSVYLRAVKLRSTLSLKHSVKNSRIFFVSRLSRDVKAVESPAGQPLSRAGLS
jgi:hypothetical protein